ncbi:MAG: polysaccharide biosynthesis C-terminal domain-containing protein [Caulobacter sp.]|jgi:O-antigen/teichoic acid export membrane protein
MFWRGVLGYLPVNVAQGVVGLLTIVVFTRLLTPADYGVYAIAYSAMVLAHTALFTWTEAAMARFQARARARGELADHVVTLYRAWSVLGLGFPVLAGLAVWLAPVDWALKVAISSGLAAILFRSLIKLVQERRRADGEVASAATLDIAQTVGGFAVGVVCAAVGLGGASPLIGLAVVSAISLVFVLPRELSLMKGGAWKRSRAMVYAGYGVPVSLSLILSLVISSTDRFVLAAFLGEAETGIYHAGYSLANRTLDVVFIWLGMAGGPAIVAALERGGKEAMQRAAREQISFMVLLTLPAAIGLALVAHPLSQVLVGPAMAEGAARVTPWIAVAAFLSGITTYYLHQAFTLGRRTELLLAAMVAPAVLNLVLNLVLVPRFGMDGALWATAASYAVGAGASWLFGRRVIRMPLPGGAILRTAIACVPMALAVMAIPAFGGFLELMAKAATGVIVFGLVGWMLDAGSLRSQGPALLRSLRQGAAA